MSKEKHDSAPTPLELLSKLDAATLDAALAEIKVEMEKLDRKRRELLTLRKALAFRNGEFKRGGGRKKAAAQETPPPPPSPAATPAPLKPVAELPARLCAVLRKLGSARPTELAIHAGAAAEKVALTLQNNKDVFECMGAGQWRLRAGK